MTREEAAGLLCTLQAAYPGFATDDVTVRLWLGYLVKANLDTARVAVDSIVTTHPRAPSLAQWQEANRAAIMQAQPSPALERETWEPTERGRQALAEIKALAASLGGPRRKQRPRGLRW